MNGLKKELGMAAILTEIFRPTFSASTQMQTRVFLSEIVSRLYTPTYFPAY